MNKSPWAHALALDVNGRVVNGKEVNGKEVNGKEVDQGIARKAQQEPEGEMEETETAAAAEALGYRSRPAIY